MVDNTGTVTQRMSFDEYGNLSPQSSSNGEPFRYTGRRFDLETGQYYYRARYYSPVLGRFLQSDPVGYKDDLNLYAYTGNDPLDRTDPSEQCPMCIVEGVELAVEGIEALEGATAATEAAEGVATAEQGAVEGQATQSLRSNMASAGREVQEGEHAHHIVAQNARAAQPARDALG